MEQTKEVVINEGIKNPLLADAYAHADADSQAILKADKTMLESIYHAVMEYSTEQVQEWINYYTERLGAVLGWSKNTTYVRRSELKTIAKGSENMPDLWEEWMEAAIRGDVGHGYHASVAQFRPRKEMAQKKDEPKAEEGEKAEGLKAATQEVKAPSKVHSSAEAERIILDNLSLLSDQGAITVVNAVIDLFLSREALQELGIRLEEAYNSEATDTAVEEMEQIQKAA